MTRNACACESSPHWAMRQERYPASRPGVELSNLKRGNTRSCGCLMREAMAAANLKHGESWLENETTEYSAWQSMWVRCRQKTGPKAKYYFLKGVKVCARWKSYRNFLQDMGRKPNPSLTLGRKDSRLGYFPSNCRWETYKQQANNPTNSNRINRK